MQCGGGYQPRFPAGYRALYRLGQGAQGVVYQCECARSARKVAVKQFFMRTPADARKAYRELRILAHLQPSARVPRVIECTQQQGTVSLVMELIDCNLAEALRGGAIRQYYVVRLILLQVLRGASACPPPPSARPGGAGHGGVMVLGTPVEGGGELTQTAHGMVTWSHVSKGVPPRAPQPHPWIQQESLFFVNKAFFDDRCSLFFDQGTPSTQRG